MEISKTVSIILLILVVLNLLLFVFGKISPIFFWITLGLAALITYKIIPRFRKVKK